VYNRVRKASIEQQFLRRRRHSVDQGGSIYFLLSLEDDRPLRASRGKDHFAAMADGHEDFENTDKSKTHKSWVEPYTARDSSSRTVHWLAPVTSAHRAVIASIITPLCLPVRPDVVHSHMARWCGLDLRAGSWTLSLSTRQSGFSITATADPKPRTCRLEADTKRGLPSPAMLSGQTIVVEYSCLHVAQGVHPGSAGPDPKGTYSPPGLQECPSARTTIFE